MAKRAAYFLLRADYFGRPLDDGVYRALFANEFEIDVFAPGLPTEPSLYPPTLRHRPVEYSSAWLRRQLLDSAWRDYGLFLATADLPMAFAGALAARARRPSLLVCDEVHVGGYEGQARGRWKSLTRWAMRRARATVITDACRIPLQRDFAALPASHPFVEYPCCYADEADGFDRDATRAALGLGPEEFVLSFAGRPSEGTGLDWALRAIDRLGSPYRLLVQTAGPPEPALDSALASLARSGRVLYRPERLGFRESLALTAAADVALVFYRNPKPQFQAMGVSSHKLCLSLWLGIPVVATRQPSFAFVEEMRAGRLIDAESDLEPAIRAVRERAAAHRDGARRALREHVRAPQRLEELTESLRRLL